MYEISIQTEFCAAHAIRVAGVTEETHGHNWRITAVFAGPELDADGLLCDFHLIERELLAVTNVLNNRNLNEVPPFREGRNPSAELVARHIADELLRRLPPQITRRAALISLTVTEAPGCAATYRPDRPA